MTYYEQLKHPNWQRKRLEVLQRDDFTCTNCGTMDEQLHVHHGAYISGLKIWEYNELSLHTLCSICHSVVTEDIKYYNEALSKMRQDHDNYEILTELVDKISIINNVDKIGLSEYIKSIPY